MPEAARCCGVDTVSTGHGCDGSTTTEEGSGDVFVNTYGLVRSGDLNRSHTRPVGPACIPHQVPLSSFSSTVFANNKNAGRKGDSFGSEVITSGSNNVFIGG